MVDRPALIDANVPTPPNERRDLAMRLPQMASRGTIAPNIEVLRKDYPFVGQLVLDADPLVLDERNYTLLENFRYLESGLRLINGYSILDLNLHATYAKGRSGIQLVQLIDGVPISHLLIHAENDAQTASAVLLSTSAVPGALSFESTPQWTDTSGAGLGRFALVADGNVAYCNGIESTIWGTPDHRVGAFLVTQATPGIAKDFTREMQTTRGSADQVAIISFAGVAPVLLVGSTRPLQGIHPFIQVPNVIASTLAVDYWGTGGWTAVSGLVDGTASGGATMAQSGRITFTSTESLARVKYEQDYVLYFYRFTISVPVTAGTAIRHVTVDAPWQSVKDVWSGIEQPIAQFHVQGHVSPDQTREVTEADSVVAELDELSTSEYLLAGFSVPQMALRWTMKSTNGTASSQATVSYWNGSAYAVVSNLADTTMGGTTNSLGQSGVMSWTPVEPGVEFRTTLNGHSLYVYKIAFAAALSAAVEVDKLEGIQAPRRMPPARFPFRFQGRLFLMGLTRDNQGHAAEYSAFQQPDVYNGTDSSDQGQALYFGDHGELMAAVEIYNRFAGSLAYLALVCTRTRTFILAGTDPSTFQIFPFSDNVGCPSPLTMTGMESAYSIAEDAQRQVAMWLSESGPVLSDASVIVPIPGLEPYFNENDARYINEDAMDQARAWYDRHHHEWNLTFPSGSGATVNTAHFAYDLQRKRWYQKVPTGYLQGYVPVETPSGHAMVYGFLDAGLVVRLENSFLWGATPVVGRVETADVIPSGTYWVKTRLRYHQIITQRKTGLSAALSITHYADGSDTGTVLDQHLMAPGGNRFLITTQSENQLAVSHRFRYAVTALDAPVELIGWSGYWQVARETVGG